MRNLICLAIALSFAACDYVSAQPILWNMHKVKNIMHDKYLAKFADRIIQKADDYIKTEPKTVVNKKKHFSEDIHNYEGLSIYYWPDTLHPQGPYLCRDGYFNPEYKDYDLPKLISFTDRLKSYSVAYYITKDSRYADQCVRELRIWFIDHETYMVPSFEYAQCAPGMWNGKGALVGLVDAYYFVDILEAIRLMDQCGFIDKKTDNGLKSWFSQFYNWACTSENGQYMRKRENNLGIAYDILIYAMASYLGLKDDCKSIAKKFVSERVNKQIAEDGRQPEELKRQTAMTYSIFNMGHILDFCIMSKNNGNDIYRKNNKRIDSALHFISSFLGHKEDFLYNENGNWSILEERICLQIERMERLKRGKKSNFPIYQYTLYDDDMFMSILS